MGGGIGMGKTCEPKAFSFQCMTEFTTNKKKKERKRKKKKRNNFESIIIKEILLCNIYHKRNKMS